MAEDKAYESLSDEELGNIGGGAGFNGNCGVLEGQFPLLGKCCSKSSSISGTVYIKTCPDCSIWTSLPDGTSLTISYIFECLQYGYGKRIKE